jgi:dTDP-4-dehydrorhamnose reductase
MKILVTGASGQLAQCLADLQPETGHDLIFFSKSDLDISDLTSVVRVISQIKPELVINCAAYTAVDKAETEVEIATAVNTIGPKNLGAVCEQFAIPIIHISTDYVFNGESQVPYREEAKTDPQSKYGETKLKGEQALLSACRYSIIIRAAWVFSEHGNNFLKTMLRLASQRNHLSIVNDQWGCPTYAGDLAKSLIQIADKMESGQSAFGVFHYCGDTACTWYEFASEIFKQAKVVRRLPHEISLEPITTDQFPTPAKRPKYSVMDCQRIIQTFGVKPSDWRAAIGYVLQRLSEDSHY